MLLLHLTLLSKMKKLLILSFALALSVSAFSQHVFYNALGTNLLTDTVSNSGTATVSTRLLPGSRSFSSVLVWITVTKLTGTVGGTITLQGSIDGTNWKAVNTNDTQTAIATITATDASNTYHYRLLGGGFPYYRISWTGTGTMTATVAAKAYRN